MRLSEHGKVRRALILLDVPIAELLSVESARGDAAEVKLENFKERIASAFRVAVRSEHHPDHGTDPADEERRAQNFREIRAFSESVKTWKIKPQTARPIHIRLPGFVAIDLTMMSAMEEVIRQFTEELNRQAESTPMSQQFSESMQRAADAVRPGLDELMRRRRSTFRSSPKGTDVESQSTRDGGRVHRVRKRWKA